MNLNVNIVVVISLYQYFTTCATESISSVSNQNEPNTDDCKLLVPYKDYNMPIPMTAKTPNPKIIRHNFHGYLILKQNQILKLSCAGSYFVSPFYSRVINEITIKCLNKSFVMYNKKTYEFKDFMCNDTPQPTLWNTNLTCQNNSDNKIFEVGFKTKKKKLKFYRICFDTKYNNTLYTWYNLQSPYIKRRQMIRKVPFYSKTEYLDPSRTDDIYSAQKKTITKILNSTYLSSYFVRFYDGHILTSGQLMANTEFHYAFEQSATFFYENTTPQWIVFNDGVWKSIELLFKKNIASGKSKRLIVTGTYDACKLPDYYEVDQPLYLVLPKSMAVPLYLWKLDYDLKKKSGVVFIGMNNPYKKIDEIPYICEVVVCPGTTVRKSKAALLFYCCKLESFEKAYGKLDPIVYEWI